TIALIMSYKSPVTNTVPDCPEAMITRCSIHTTTRAQHTAKEFIRNTKTPAVTGKGWFQNFMQNMLTDCDSEDGNHMGGVQGAKQHDCVASAMDVMEECQTLSWHNLLSVKREEDYVVRLFTVDSTFPDWSISLTAMHSALFLCDPCFSQSPLVILGYSLLGAGEKAVSLSELTALADDRGLVPSSLVIARHCSKSSCGDLASVGSCTDMAPLTLCKQTHTT
ncbi:hypothetical protein STEG23_003934, partial [Scotinomys teguina]